MTPYMKTFLAVVAGFVLLIFTLNHAHAADDATTKMPTPVFWMGAESCGRATIWIVFVNGQVGRIDKPTEELRELTESMQIIPHSTVTFTCPTKLST